MFKMPVKLSSGDAEAEVGYTCLEFKGEVQARTIDLGICVDGI